MEEEDKSQVAVKVTFEIFICVVGLVGNFINILIILVWKEYKKLTMNWYVLQLALADSVFLITLPFKISEDLNNGWIYSNSGCKAVQTILFLNYYASILFLMVMSIDRYIMVCHPFSDTIQRVRKPCLLIVASTWIIAILSCIPVTLYSHKAGKAPNCKCSYKFPQEINHTAMCLEIGINSTEELAECLDHLSSTGNINPEEPHCKYELEDLNFTEMYNEIGSGIHEGSQQYPDLSGGGDMFSRELPINISQHAKYNPYYKDYIFDPNTTNEEGGSYINDIYDEFYLNILNNYDNSSNKISPYCNYNESSHGWIYFLVVNFLAAFVLPLLVMAICYGLIIRKLYKMDKKKRKNFKSKDKNMRRVTIMCVAFVSSFVICWLPFHSVHLAKIVGISSPDGHFCTTLDLVSTLLAYFNSTLNPILYNIERLQKAICKVVRKKKVTSASASRSSNQHNKVSKDVSSSMNATRMTKVSKFLRGNQSSASESSKLEKPNSSDVQGELKTSV